jgi:hypothetical protein
MTIGKYSKTKKELPDLTFRGLTKKEKIGFFYFCGLAVGLGTLGISIVLAVLDLLLFTGPPIKIGSILGAALFFSLAANWWFLPLPLPFWLEKEGSAIGAASMILPILIFVVIAFVFLSLS